MLRLINPQNMSSHLKVQHTHVNVNNCDVPLSGHVMRFMKISMHYQQTPNTEVQPKNLHIYTVIYFSEHIFNKQENLLPHQKYSVNCKHSSS